MKLERVKHADVYPSDGNPRRDFGDLKSMAEGFQLNPENPGEPLTPPIVVRDGQVFRIVDGERRWRAMQIAGTKEFSAIVCDDWDDADAALAMLATSWQACPRSTRATSPRTSRGWTSSWPPPWTTAGRPTSAAGRS